MPTHPKIAMVILLLFSLLVNDAAAQSNELAQSYNQYQALKAQGRYADAEPFARTALELSQQQLGKTHKTTAVFLSNLAFLIYAQPNRSTNNRWPFGRRFLNQTIQLLPKASIASPFCTMR